MIPIITYLLPALNKLSVSTGIIWWRSVGCPSGHHYTALWEIIWITLDLINTIWSHCESRRNRVTRWSVRWTQIEIYSILRKPAAYKCTTWVCIVIISIIIYPTGLCVSAWVKVIIITAILEKTILVEIIISGSVIISPLTVKIIPSGFWYQSFFFIGYYRLDFFSVFLLVCLCSIFLIICLYSILICNFLSCLSILLVVCFCSICICADFNCFSILFIFDFLCFFSLVLSCLPCLFFSCRLFFRSLLSICYFFSCNFSFFSCLLACFLCLLWNFLGICYFRRLFFAYFYSFNVRTLYIFFLTLWNHCFIFNKFISMNLVTGCTCRNKQCCCRN